MVVQVTIYPTELAALHAYTLCEAPVHFPNSGKVPGPFVSVWQSAQPVFGFCTATALSQSVVAPPTIELGSSGKTSRAAPSEYEAAKAIAAQTNGKVLTIEVSSKKETLKQRPPTSAVESTQ